jgi:dinuclear metal center YbgI/SA1388 family protein
MTVREVQEILAAWAPPAIAWEEDNPGLQCGDPAAPVRRILVTLDVTSGTVAEARRRRCDMIVSHHPLLFTPLRSVTPSRPEGRILRELIARNIALYSAHTNLDFTRGGTSFALAEALDLTEIRFLETTSANQKKIVTFVPAAHADAVAAAMAASGAGRIGDYDHCSFRVEGTGTFLGNERSNPTVGRAGRIERAGEIRLEMIVPAWNVEAVVRAMRTAHPYEEVAYDVYPLENPNPAYGMGVIGTLKRPSRLIPFLRRLKRTLGTGALRWTGDPARSIRSAALCGGSGGRLLEAAVRARAEVFVTADIRYHAFHDAAGRIALVDAGHYETEAPVIGAVVRRLKNESRRTGGSIDVLPAARSTNPVQYL